MTTATNAAVHGQAKKLNIFINDQKFATTEQAMTGAQLKALAGVSEANQIFLDVPGNGDDEQVLDDIPFELKSGMKFFDIPVGNLGLS